MKILSWSPRKILMKSKYDVVILGAGHNGLVAAAYLALAMVFRLLFAGLYQLVFARR